MPGEAQNQRAIGFEGFHGEVFAAPLDSVAFRQLLELGQDAIRARSIQKAKQPIERVIAVQTAAPGTNLYQPRPDVSWRRVHGDSLSLHMSGIRDHRVPRHNASS